MKLVKYIDIKAPNVLLNCANLTSGVNFINVLRTAFTCVDHKSHFVLLGSMHVNAARKHVGKIGSGYLTLAEVFFVNHQICPQTFVQTNFFFSRTYKKLNTN